MKKTILFISLFLLTITIPCISYADDTDIYNIAEGVKPNVLIIFDNSGSMEWGIPYDDSTTYSGSYETDTIYRRECTQWWWIFCLNWDWVPYSGTFTDTNSDGIDDNNSYIRRGNRLNYDFSDQSMRLSVAKAAVKDVIDQTADHVRFGIMVLNGAKDINDWGTTFQEYHNDTTVLSSTYGGAIIEDRDAAGIQTLKNQIDNMQANGGTPLANRLINAAQYFRGSFGSYASPLNQTYWCRRNFVIIMTDGRPEGEGNSLSANNNGDYDHIEGFMDANGVSRDYDSDGADPDPNDIYVNGGSDYLDDVAGYLYQEEDLRGDVEGVQNITVYTIGFVVDHELLNDTAKNGGGEYYTASNADELSKALIKTLTSIIEKTQTFTAPVVPIQRTTSGDKMYISLFTPKSDKNFWPGYLIKVGIGSDGGLLANDGETPVTDSEGRLNEDLINPNRSPNPYWDVHNVLKGSDLSSRNIYTYVGTSVQLNDASNLFVGSNSSITATMLDNPAKQEGADPSTSARDDLISYIRGWDSYDEDEDGIYSEKRDDILGDILHSRPLIIDYSDTEKVIYFGANDGMLHAIDDSDGSEKWAFIPPDLLPKLKDIIEGTGHQYFVDSSPKAYILDNDRDGIIEVADNDQVIIIFGERRGGTSYTALDVSDPDLPQFLWRIDSTDTSGTYGIPAPTTVISEMGQTWSEPQIGKVKVGSADKVVAFIGGGFSYDNTKGRAFYLIRVSTGELFKSFTVSDHPDLLYSIPSTVLAVDTTFDGYINRVYVGDLGGQVWRFGLHRTDADDTRIEDGNINNWTPRLLFKANTSSIERKIFYPFDLVLEMGYEYLYFGTGDRTDPMETAVVNRFYAVKDRNKTNDVFTSPLTESDLVDVTSNVLQEDPGSPEAEATLNNLTLQDGWYITLEEQGEKVLASPTVIYGMAIFTTFIPDLDPCSYGGAARVYVVDYLTAEAVMNLDTTNDLEGEAVLKKSDRSKSIGYGIPTEVVITITETGKIRGYVGTGEYIVKIDLPSPAKSFNPYSWRELF
ncbi:MAG: type IV pilin biogenesis protein [Deltaproteobacteria bacterium]|nr:type IV pilin biogenesis protein [Deltaproteobacteria bacterium]